MGALGLALPFVFGIWPHPLDSQAKSSGSSQWSLVTAWQLVCRATPSYLDYARVAPPLMKLSSYTTGGDPTAVATLLLGVIANSTQIDVVRAVGTRWNLPIFLIFARTTSFSCVANHVYILARVWQCFSVWSNQASTSIVFSYSRVYEKIMERMQEIGASVTGMKKTIAGWAKRKGLQGNQNKQKKWG